MRFLSLLLFLSFTATMMTNDVAAQKKHKDKKEHQSKADEEHVSNLEIKDACKKQESLERIKADMTPYRFDKVNTIKVFYKPYDKSKAMAVPLYHTTGYKFIINSEGMPTELEIVISDKPLTVSTAVVLHTSKEKHFVYELPKDFEGTRIYISLKVPADKEFNNGVRNKGCVLIGSGYQNLDF